MHPADLAAHTVRAVVERSGIDPGAVDDVILGIPVAALRRVCAPLVAARPEWRAMVDNVATVCTHARRTSVATRITSADTADCTRSKRRASITNF